MLANDSLVNGVKIKAKQDGNDGLFEKAFVDLDDNNTDTD